MSYDVASLQSRPSWCRGYYGAKRSVNRLNPEIVEDESKNQIITYSSHGMTRLFSSHLVASRESHHVVIIVPLSTTPNNERLQPVQTICLLSDRLRLSNTRWVVTSKFEIQLMNVSRQLTWSKCSWGFQKGELDLSSKLNQVSGEFLHPFSGLLTSNQLVVY